MKDIDDHWERIANGPWADVYLEELYWLARGTSELCLQVFEAAPSPPPMKTYLFVDHGVHGKIYRILNNSARLASLMRERPRRGRSQSASQYAVQQKRVKWLRNVVAGVEIRELLDAKVRHSLEHFDEFIDETALKSSRGEISRPTFFPMDVVMGRESTLDVFAKKDLSGVTSYPVRVYIGEDQTFINCGRKIDMGRIYAECMGLYERLAEVSPKLQNTEVKSSDERGGGILLITDESFAGGSRPDVVLPPPESGRAYTLNSPPP